ncbi:MAG: hypothetical protein NVS1B11_15110 [Terriglobales bacterium]
MEWLELRNWMCGRRIIKGSRLCPAVGFVNPGGGVGGDYHLAATSSFKGKGMNNSDPGADVDAVNAVTAGVE